MNNKNKFQEMLADILEVAKVQGNKLSVQEIKSLFGGMDLNDKQFEQIFAYLTAYHINIEGYVGGVTEYTKAVEQSDCSDGPELETEPLKDKSKDTKEVDSIYLKMYLEDLEAMKDCSEEENITLIKHICEHDDDAKNRFIEGNLRLVVELAKEYRNQGITLEDLIQEGNIGLLNSVDCLSYLQDIGNWKQFVSNYIRKSIDSAIKEQENSCNFENSIVKKIKFLNDAANELAEDLGRKADIHELAAYTNLSLKEIGDILNLSADAVALGNHES